jgi:hypothetical protein
MVPVAPATFWIFRYLAIDVAPHAPRPPVTVFYMYGYNIIVPKFVLAL